MSKQAINVEIETEKLEVSKLRSACNQALSITVFFCQLSFAATVITSCFKGYKDQCGQRYPIEELYVNGNLLCPVVE